MLKRRSSSPNSNHYDSKLLTTKSIKLNLINTELLPSNSQLTDIKSQLQLKFLSILWCPQFTQLGVAILLPNRLSLDEKFKLDDGGFDFKTLKKLKFRLWLIRLKPNFGDGSARWEDRFERLDRWTVLVDCNRVMSQLETCNDQLPSFNLDRLRLIFNSGLHLVWHPSLPKLYMVFNQRITSLPNIKLDTNTDETNQYGIIEPQFDYKCFFIELNTIPSSTNDGASLTLLEVDVESNQFVITYSSQLSINDTEVESSSSLPLSSSWVKEPNHFHQLRSPTFPTTALPPLSSFESESRIKNPENLSDTGISYPNHKNRVQSNLHQLLHNGLGQSYSEMVETVKERELLASKWDILKVRVSNEDICLCVQGRYHMGTIPATSGPVSDIKHLPSLSDGITSTELSPGFSPSEMELAKYLPYHSPEVIYMGWVHTSLVRSFKLISHNLEQFQFKLKHHISSFENQMKSFQITQNDLTDNHSNDKTVSPPNPIDLLHNFIVTGLDHGDVTTFLDPSNLGKFESWSTSYLNDAKDVTLSFENDILFPTKNLLSQLSLLNGASTSISSTKRKLFNLATAYTSLICTRGLEFLALLNKDTQQFKQFINFIIQYLEYLIDQAQSDNEDDKKRVPKKMPLPHPDTFNYLKRVNISGPTEDLFSFFNTTKLSAKDSSLLLTHLAPNSSLRSYAHALSEFQSEFYRDPPYHDRLSNLGVIDTLTFLNTEFNPPKINNDLSIINLFDRLVHSIYNLHLPQLTNLSTYYRIYN